MTITQHILPEATQSEARPHYRLRRYEDLVGTPALPGDRDDWSVSAVLDLLPTLPTWTSREKYGTQDAINDGARTILEWLTQHGGDGWQERWVNSGADEGKDWIDALVDAGNPRCPRSRRATLVGGLTSLLLCRIFMPSYRFLNAYQAFYLFAYTRQTFRSDLFAVIEQHADELNVGAYRRKVALAVVSKIVLHTGRDLDKLTADDVFTFRATSMRERGKAEPGLPLVWSMLRQVTDLGQYATFKEAIRYGQRPTAELVDAYKIKSATVREVLVRYLDERRPSIDYNSLTTLVGRLVGRFWADIERHHPGIDSLELSDDVAYQWKHRGKTRVLRDGSTRPRADYYDILITVRSFYKDLQEWAHEDPSWARWAVRNPIRRSDTVGSVNARKNTTAAMHQRTRERLPHLAALVAASEEHKTDQAALLAATRAAKVGERFSHGRREYRRIVPSSYNKPYWRGQPPPDMVLDLGANRRIDVGRSEHEAFMAWAIIEVLRHTGVRVEELLEITHLALAAAREPGAGQRSGYAHYPAAQPERRNRCLDCPLRPPRTQRLPLTSTDRRGGGSPEDRRHVLSGRQR